MVTKQTVVKPTKVEAKTQARLQKLKEAYVRPRTELEYILEQ
jgi:hypothetical protein